MLEELEAQKAAIKEEQDAVGLRAHEGAASHKNSDSKTAVKEERQEMEVKTDNDDSKGVSPTTPQNPESSVEGAKFEVKSENLDDDSEGVLLTSPQNMGSKTAVEGEKFVMEAENINDDAQGVPLASPQIIDSKSTVQEKILAMGIEKSNDDLEFVLLASPQNADSESAMQEGTLAMEIDNINNDDSECVLLESPIKEDESRISIIIKQESAPDELNHVSLIRGPDGDSNTFDLSQLGCGPNLKFDSQYNRGFSRRVIYKTFGDNGQKVALNWQGPTKWARGREPYLCFKTEQNPSLSIIPGQHGIILTGRDYLSHFNDGTPVSQDIPIFVARSPNSWVFKGLYNVRRSGVVSPHHFNALPGWCIDTWVQAFLKKGWGKEKIARVNQRLEEEAEERGEEVGEVIPMTEEGVRAALRNGYLEVTFGILQCVGYRKEWLDKLVEAEERLGLDAAPTKITAVGRKKKIRKVESDDEEDDESRPKKKRRRAGVKKEEVKEEMDFMEERNEATEERTQKRRCKKEDPVVDIDTLPKRRSLRNFKTSY